MTNWAQKIGIAREARQAGQSLRGQRQETGILVPLWVLEALLQPMTAPGYWAARAEAKALLHKPAEKE